MDLAFTAEVPKEEINGLPMKEILSYYQTMRGPQNLKIQTVAGEDPWLALGSVNKQTKKRPKGSRPPSVCSSINLTPSTLPLYPGLTHFKNK